MRLIGALALILAGGACETHDLGKKCGTLAEPVPDPVEGEVPTVEVVRVERDSDCESFQCLTHRGLPPYCTRTCAVDSPPKARHCDDASACAAAPFAGVDRPGECLDGTCRCTADNQCKNPTHCVDGACVDDDCPAGYWCERVQDVGPLASNRYCVYKTGCETNSDCESFSTMACKGMGCYDACQRKFYTCEEPTGGDCATSKCTESCARVSATQALCPQTSGTEACITDNCLVDCTPPPESCDFHRLVCQDLRQELACLCPSSATPEVLGPCPEQDIVCYPDATAGAWPSPSVRKLYTCMPK